MINYSIDKKIVTITLKGEIGISEISNFIKEFSKLDHSHKDLLVLCDLLNADIKIDPEGLNELSQQAENSTKKYSSVKTAYVVDEPMLTAYAMLFATFLKDKKTRRNIFTTKKAALIWLLERH